MPPCFGENRPPKSAQRVLSFVLCIRILLCNNARQQQQQLLLCITVLQLASPLRSYQVRTRYHVVTTATVQQYKKRCALQALAFVTRHGGGAFVLVCAVLSKKNPITAGHISACTAKIKCAPWRTLAYHGSYSFIYGNA